MFSFPKKIRLIYRNIACIYIYIYLKDVSEKEKKHFPTIHKKRKKNEIGTIDMRMRL